MSEKRAVLWEDRWQKSEEDAFNSKLKEQEALAENARLNAKVERLRAELLHLVRLLEPMERDGTLNVPGLATLNGARAALAVKEAESG